MKRSILRSPRTSIFVAFIIGLLFISKSYADDHMAATLSPADIQAAVNAANPGDYVILPAGHFIGFNTTVNIPNGISIRGAGKSSSIMQHTSDDTIVMFKFNDSQAPSSYQVEISDFSLYGNNVQNPLDTGIATYQVVDFKIHDVGFRYFGYCGYLNEGWSRGVVYDCDFIDNYVAGHGYGIVILMNVTGDTRRGDYSWTQYPADTDPGWGTNQFIFVEDCYFSGNRHGIDSNWGGRYVSRYNTFEGQVPGEYAAFMNVHGRTPFDSGQRGTRAIEVYHNTLTIDDYADGISLQSGDGLIWGNTLSGTISGGHGIMLTDAGYTRDPDDYPASDQMRNAYIWGNTENGSDSDSDIYPAAIPGVGNFCPEWLVKNRDFYLFTYSYAPFPYPHPLRGSMPHLSLSTSSMVFSATAGGNMPSNQFFQISNSGGGTLNWTITDNADWLTYNPTSGQGNSSIAVSVNHTGLTVGTHNATITVNSSNAENAPQNVSVAFNVSPATAPLIASLLASPSSGSAPLVVNLSGSATGGTAPYTYSWSFGDGQTSTVQNSTHTYSMQGTYSAVLTVTDSQNATDTETATITVSSGPIPLTATASGSPTSGQAPLTVNFTGSASGGISPYSYSWNFGDGAYADTQNPSHTYTSSGMFTATLTITDSYSSTARSAAAISVGSANSYSLSLSAETGSPAPGQGGTTDPTPGNYTFPIGSLISLKSLPNTDYRFSRWNGDIQETSLFDFQTAITIDQNKFVSSTFCTKCGDVNGDLQISPADAQAAFDIFLGKITNPTWCEKENADVNSSGIKLDPKVTPADSQIIFNIFLKKGETGDCSGDSRSATLAIDSQGTAPVRLAINGITAGHGEDIYVPIIIDSNAGISAFGLDVAFSSRALTFLGVEQTEFTQGYQDVAANVLLSSMDSENDLDQRPDFGIVRVGGYRTESAQSPTSGVLVVLVFRVTGELEVGPPISIIATYDDLRNAFLTNGMIESQTRGEYARKSRGSEKRSIAKRYDF